LQSNSKALLKEKNRWCKRKSSGHWPGGLEASKRLFLKDKTYKLGYCHKKIVQSRCENGSISQGEQLKMSEILNKQENLEKLE
jgi:hypothetical protein